MKRLYTNARIISPGVDLPNASVLEEEGVVVQIYPPSMALPSFDEAIDCDGHLLAPGFFDIHARAAKAKDVAKMAKQARKSGVTNLLVAVEDGDYDVIAQYCRETAAVMEKNCSGAARVFGMHLAGPYGNTDFLEVKSLHQLCPIRKITFDVELAGAMDFSQKLRKEGIVPCCGGGCTEYDVLAEALQNGIQGLEKDYPETAKAVKAELEAEAKAKAEAQAAKEKAEREAFEKEQKELEDAWDQYASPPFVNPAELNPWGAGRIQRRGNPLEQLSDEEREALFQELDKGGLIKGPDVLPKGGPAPYRPAVKRD